MQLPGSYSNLFIVSTQAPVLQIYKIYTCIFKNATPCRAYEYSRGLSSAQVASFTRSILLFHPFFALWSFSLHNRPILLWTQEWVYLHILLWSLLILNMWSRGLVAVVPPLLLSRISEGCWICALTSWTFEDGQNRTYAQENENTFYFISQGSLCSLHVLDKLRMASLLDRPGSITETTVARLSLDFRRIYSDSNLSSFLHFLAMRSIWVTL